MHMYVSIVHESYNDNKWSAIVMGTFSFTSRNIFLYQQALEGQGHFFLAIDRLLQVFCKKGGDVVSPLED